MVAEYWGQVSTIDNNGNQLPGWQYDMGNQIWGTPAIGDLDGDGENEIVLTSKNGKAVILDINGNELLEYDAGQFLMGTPALGNLDMDEDLEIVFGGYTPSGKIFAINSDGSDVSGLSQPQTVTDAGWGQAQFPPRRFTTPAWSEPGGVFARME